MCSSRNLLGVGSDGAPIITLGALVHREQRHRATYLSGQQHDDAVDAGADLAARHSGKAFSIRRIFRRPPRSRIISAAISERLDQHDLGRWFRIAPGRQFSMPLQTMSYWNAVIFSIVASVLTSSFENASWSKFGIENGLWREVDLLSSSLHPYIGKSTTQQKA